jgi:hypothetical protein
VKFTKKDRDTLIQLLTAFAQVTFGVLWAALFLPIEQYKPTVIILNLATTIAIIAVIWLLNRK